MFLPYLHSFEISVCRHCALFESACASPIRSILPTLTVDQSLAPPRTHHDDVQFFDLSINQWSQQRVHMFVFAFIFFSLFACEGVK